MSSIPPSELIYGHLGTPVYDSATGTWHFPRQHATNLWLKPLGVVRSAGLYRPSPEDADTSLATRHVNSISSSNAVVFGACGAIDAVIDDSRPDSQDSENFHCSSGDIVAYAKCSDQTKQRSPRQEPLLATVAGKDREILRLALLIQENVAWDQHSPLNFQKWTAVGSEIGWWTSAGEPIQQICASTEAEYDFAGFNFLAVRCASGISVLAPVLQPEKATPETCEDPAFFLDASRIQANCIARIEWQTESTAPFTDVAFNLWNSRQFATVDVAGYWVVWDLRLRKADRHAWRARATIRCSTKPNARESGFAMTTWACDSDTLVLAGEKSLVVQDLKTLSNHADCSGLVLKDENERLLDMKCPSAHTNHLYILTNHKISILSVDKVQEKSVRYPTIVVKLLLSWIHYRDPRDFSLRISWSNALLASSEADIVFILLYSRLVGPVTVFTFRHQEFEPKCISMLDPYDLEFQQESDETSGPRLTRQLPCLTVHCKPLLLNTVTEPSSLDLEGFHDEIGCGLFQLTAVLDDHTIIEALYCIAPARDLLEQPQAHIIPVPDYPIALRDTQDDFLDHDDLEAMRYLLQGTLMGAESTAPAHGRDTDTVVSDPRTLNLEHLSRALERFSNDQIIRGSANRSSFDDLVKTVQAVQDETGNSRSIRRLTLYDVLKANAGSVACDIRTNDLKQIFHIAASENGGDLHQLTDGSLTLLQGRLEEFPIREISQALRELLPPWTDLREEAEARQNHIVAMAASSLYLSSYAMTLSSRLESVEEDVDQSQSEQSAGMRFGRLTYGSSPDSDLSQSLPSVAASSQPESIGSSSQQSATSLGAGAALQATSSQDFRRGADEASHRLGTLTSLSAQPPLPRQFSNLLDTWNVGGDPDQVDWPAARFSLLSMDGTDRDTDAGHLQGKKQKKKRKLEQRPVENDEEVLAAQALPVRPVVIESQSLPIRGSGSQPDPRTTEAAATQSSDTPFVSTQPVAGPHGRRQKAKNPAKNPAKKKLPGF